MSTAVRCGAELELAASAQLAHTAATLHMKKPGYCRGDLRRSLMDLRVDVIRKQCVWALNLRAPATWLGGLSGEPHQHLANRSDLLAAIAQQAQALARAVAQGKV